MSNSKEKHSGAGRHDQLADLLEIMAALRDPDTGCPWDQKQTFRTIAPYTIEEAYEVADAIERGDFADLRDELGDLLFQVVYYSQMAREEGRFDFHDVVQAVSEKMIRRHPHVFGTEAERAAGAAPGFWERLKDVERAEKRAARRALGVPEPEDGFLADVPANLPPLSQAVKLQKRAARVGFDWPDLAPVLAKMREEIEELAEAAERQDRDAVEDEFGDLMFVLANVARHLKIDPEASLRRTNQKFRRRFARIEAGLAARGRSLEDATLDEMDALWNAAKREEKSGADEPSTY